MRLATSLGLFTSLVAAIPGVDVGADVDPLLTIDLSLFPDHVLSGQCNECCPTTIRTIISKIYTTIYSEKTIYTTATQHDVSTKVQYTTKYVATTALSTYTKSYPVTVTKTIDCDPPYKSDNESVGSENTALVPKLKGRTYGCRTTTITSWATTTATKTVTGIESIVTTQTVPHETTIHDTRTIVDSTTIWVPTTYTETKTVVSEHPVTLTVDNTKYTTKSTTIVTTFVSTVTTSFPIVTTLTLPGQTYTAPGETVTAPGYNVTETLQGPTVTAPGQTSTITLPGVTKTLPGSTVVTTQIRTLPPSTIHVTDEQQTKTVTRSGYTVIETSTVTLPPTTIDRPATTVTVTPMFEVTLCPTPTGAAAPLDPKSNRTFGCEPGYVCNPPKPDGCNLWPEPPSDTFLCDPNDCIPSPPLANVTWHGCETSYYPPSYGYFNLNPEAFGLSYDIFQYKVINEIINGHPSLITTGNWGSQTSLTAWPKPSPTTKSEPALYGRMGKRTNDHKACRKSKRDITTPSVCYEPCNKAYNIAQSVGKSDKLCQDGSDFKAAIGSCGDCIKANSNSNPTPTGGSTGGSTGYYTHDKFEQWLNFCSGGQAEKPPTASPTTPEQVVSHQPTLGTSTQVDVSPPTFTPIPSSWSLTQSSPSTPSPTNIAGSTSVSDTPSSHAGSTSVSDTPSSHAGSTSVSDTPSSHAGSTSVSDTPSSHTTRPPPSSRQSSSISTLPGSVSGGSASQSSSTSHNEGTSSPTTTQITATETAVTQTTAIPTTAIPTTATHTTTFGTTASSSSPSSSGNTIGKSFGSSSSSGPGSVPNSKNGNASGTSPSPSESTSNVNNANGGSSQLGNTTDSAPGNPPTSTPPTVTAAASRLSSLIYSVGAILVSSAVIIMC